MYPVYTRSSLTGSSVELKNPALFQMPSDDSYRMGNKIPLKLYFVKIR